MSEPNHRDSATSGALGGSVTVVTGAGRGIGREIALRHARAGADLVLAARSVGALDETRSLVEAEGREALAVPTDVTDDKLVDGLARRALERYKHVDTVVNNSGVAGPSAPLWDIEPGDWEETLAVNVTGTYRCCRAFLPGMIDRGRGSVIMIGSMTGKRPLVDRTPYAASKLALVGLTRTLALEAGPYGVRVNLVSPGAVEGERIEVIGRQAQAYNLTVEEARARFTEGSPLGRLTSAGDVADATVFLASDRASSITGEDLNVSAGMVMH